MIYSFGPFVLCLPIISFFSFSFFGKWITIIGSLERYLSQPRQGGAVWLEGFFVNWVWVWWFWDLKMGGFGVLVANCLWVFLFSPSFTFLSGIEFQAFSSILVVYPSLLHTLLAPTTFLGAVRDVNRHNSSATYISRLHMYYYL